MAKSITNMFARIVIILISLSIANYAMAQGRTVAERTNLADRYYQQKEYGKALKILEIINERSDNPLIDYKIGVCYANSPNNKIDAIPYLEKARDSNDPRISNDVYLYLGQLYHYTYRFIEAVNMLTFYKESPRVDAQKNQMADRIIQFCQNGKTVLGRRSPKISIEFMGFPINTSYNDFAALISNDGRTMALTSDRLKNRFDLVYADQYTFIPDSLKKNSNDIFISTLISDNNWSTPEASEVDGEEVTSLSISDNAQKLWYYEQNLEGANLPGISMIERNRKGKWKNPEELDINFLSAYPIKGAYFTANGKVLYFASIRPEGFGGYDIYWTHKINKNQWAEPKNLGPSVNTPYDEVNPFMHADNRTLYFSSDGHNSMGYLDIFRTKKQGAGWLNAINMGFPINSSYNDDHFAISTDSEHIYLSSDRNEEGSFGQYDILRVYLQKDNVPVTKVDGFIKIIENGQSIPVHLEVKEELSGAEQQYIFNPSSETGEYYMLLFPGKAYHIKLLYDAELKTNSEGFVSRYDNETQRITESAAKKKAPKNSIELSIAIPDSAYHYQLDILAKKETIKFFGKELAEKITVQDSFQIKKAVKQPSEEEVATNRYDAMIELINKIVEYKDTLSLVSLDSILVNDSPFELAERKDMDQLIAVMLSRMNEAVEDTDIQKVIDLKNPLAKTERERLQIKVTPQPDLSNRNIYHKGEIVYERNNARYDDLYNRELKALVTLLKAAKNLRVDLTHLTGSKNENNIVAGKRISAISSYLIQSGIRESHIRTFFDRHQDPSKPFNTGNSPIVKIVIYEDL